MPPFIEGGYKVRSKETGVASDDLIFTSQKYIIDVKKHLANIVIAFSEDKGHGGNYQAWRQTFSNAVGELRTPKDLFTTPPAGAGECAAPKLLQYAYQHDLMPLAIAEFWWGAPPSSAITTRSHGAYYPACEDKCRGVLGWMLG